MEEVKATELKPGLHPSSAYYEDYVFFYFKIPEEESIATIS